MWCLDALPSSTYRSAIFIAREKYYRAHVPSLRMSSPVSVVWHIRVGDRNLRANNAEHYRNLFALLQRRVHVFQVLFLYDCIRNCVANKAPAGYQFLEGLCVSNCQFDNSASVRDHMKLMINADILITSGSSFSYAAAMYSNKIVIYTPNKMVECPKCFLVEHYIYVGDQGAIEVSEEAKFVSQLRLLRYWTTG